MSSETPALKLGAAIYLRSRSPLRLAAFVSDFKKRWPEESLIDEGQEGDCAFFAVGDSRVAIEVRNEPIPQAVTDAVLPSTRRHWPSAETELALHLAHLKIATTPQRGKELGSASALTKIVAALLCVTDSIGVCWLNGPVLHPAQSFVGIASEMFGAGVPPLMLWVGVHWKPEESLLHTKGLVQFDAPEILIAQQKDPSPEWVEYLLEVAYYAMTSGKEILDGETMDGPRGVLTIQSIRGSDYPSRKGLMLVPARPN